MKFRKQKEAAVPSSDTPSYRVRSVLRVSGRGLERRFSTPSNTHNRRAAHAQPRVLVAAMLALMISCTWWAVAQLGNNTSSPTTTLRAGGADSSGGSDPWSHLPGMVEAYGEQRALQIQAASGGSGIVKRGFALTEVDLTANTPASNELEAAYRPDGEFIAFASNGIDSDGDGRIDPDNLSPGGRYHIWIMRRDGTGQRQVTGLGDDSTRDQRSPSWSPDGNRLVYIDDEDGIASSDTQLYLLSLSLGGGTPIVQQQLRLTNFRGDKRSPSWSPSGTDVAFSTDTRPATRFDAHPNDNFDIYTVPTDANISNIRRLTGGANDSTGNETDDLNPAYSLVNGAVIYFSSNRSTNDDDTQTALHGQPGDRFGAPRRIWAMGAISGAGKRQITDPTTRPGGHWTNKDDYPAPSMQIAGFSERLAFESNSGIDASDTTIDYNIWTIAVDSDDFAVTSLPAQLPPPALMVSSYNGGQVREYNAEDGTYTGRATSNFLSNPEGVTFGPDLTGDRYPEFYVSNRGAGRVDYFNGLDLTFLSTFARNPGTMPRPTDLKFFTRPFSSFPSLFVGSGNGGTGGGDVTRFDYNPNTDNLPINSGTVFTTGDEEDDNPGRITNGIEGIFFGPDANGDRVQDLYVSALVDHKINVYSGQDGQFIRVFVAPGTGGLGSPIGLTFGPDISGDGRQDLYVSSSGGSGDPTSPAGAVSGVLVFTGPDATGSGGGEFIKVLVRQKLAPPATPTPEPTATTAPTPDPNDPNPAPTATPTPIATTAPTATPIPTTPPLIDPTMDSPEGLVFGPDGDLYVSIFGSTRRFGSGQGSRVNRYTVASDGTAEPNPSSDPAVPQGVYPSAFVNDPGLRGAGYLVFNPVADGSLNQDQSVQPVETNNSSAKVETNLLSSPDAANNAGFEDATEDQANDIHPNFARTIATEARLAGRIAFSSQRKTANAPANDPANPTPTVVNPGGGSNNEATFDIWATDLVDTTPPLLVPTSFGGQLYPFLSPGPQAVSAGITVGAARVPEEGGLSPGDLVTVGLVLRDRENGIDTVGGRDDDASTPSSVRIRLKNAGRPTFFSSIHQPDQQGLNVEIQTEQAPQVVPGFDFNNSELQLKVYDNGPVSQGGNERQSNAIAGDGEYYCETTFTSPSIAADFYIDLQVQDRGSDSGVFNRLIYDHVYGFSTRPFTKQNKFLFVSDYTVGQSFPTQLTSFAGRSGLANAPVESYFLNNPGGRIILDEDPDPNDPTGGSIAPQDMSLSFTDDGPADISTIAGGAEVDTWRTLSRGGVPQDVFNLYRPTLVEQLDPDADDDGQPGPFVTTTTAPDGSQTQTDNTRQVAASDTAVVFASPYTGNVFAGPGTLNDPETRRRLIDFLGAGGRLIITGNDIAYALDRTADQSEAFLRDELGAAFASESFSVDLTGSSDTFIVNADPFGGRVFPPDSPQFPRATGNGTNTKTDAAGASSPDVITTVEGADMTITPLYSYSNGGLAAQRIEKVRSGAIESRVAFFAFGLESVHRGYHSSQQLGTFSHNYRSKIFANAFNNYLLTGRITGRVFNAATNQPINNFYVKITGSSLSFVARTDANGNFDVSGVPPGGYSVSPVTGAEPAVNQGYFLDTGDSTGVIGGGTGSVTLRVMPLPPASVSGTAIDDNGTPNDLTDDGPVVQNLPVLIRSIDPIPSSGDIFPAGGYFAALEKTRVDGTFSFSPLPANVEYEIIFNPTPGKVSEGGDFPDESGDFNYPSPQFGPNPDFDRRVIPVERNPNNEIYGGPYNGPNPIAPEEGTNLDVGEVPIPRAGTLVPAPTPTPTVAPSPTPDPNATPDPNVTPTPTVDPNATPTPTVDPNATATPIGVPTSTPTVGPTVNPTTGGTPGPTTGGTPGPTTGGTPGPTTGATPNPTTGGPAPTATPIPLPTQDPGIIEYQVGEVYQISIPFMDPGSNTTTPARAFSVPPIAPDGTLNYVLKAFDAKTQKYEPEAEFETLGNDAILQRGQGYFLRPVSRSVRIITPAENGSRTPTSATEFEIVLRRDPSRPARDPNNGYNLIGFPFNPRIYRIIDWTNSTVITPDGRTYSSLDQAVAAGILSRELQTLNGGSYSTTTSMEPYKGYWARTFVDGTRVIVKAGRGGG